MLRVHIITLAVILGGLLPELCSPSLLCHAMIYGSRPIPILGASVLVAPIIIFGWGCWLIFPLRKGFSKAIRWRLIVFYATALVYCCLWLFPLGVVCRFLASPGRS